MSAPITFADQQNFISQDLAMRRLAYPKMIEGGQIAAELADRHLEILAAIGATMTLLTNTGGKLPRGMKAKRNAGLPLVVYFETKETRAEFIKILNDYKVTHTLEVPK